MNQSNHKLLQTPCCTGFLIFLCPFEMVADLIFTFFFIFTILCFVSALDTWTIDYGR